MVAGKIAGISKQDYLWQVMPSFVTCSGSYCQNLMRIQKNQAQIWSKDPVWSACLLLPWVQSMTAEQVSFHDGFSWFSCLDSVSQPQMDVPEAILLYWRTMLMFQHLVEQASVRFLLERNTGAGRGIRGLGPKGARVVHSVCIVHQVLGSSQKHFYLEKSG